MIEHILDRSFLHMMMGAAVFLMCDYGIQYLRRRYASPRFEFWYQKAVAALLGVYLISLREPYDVWNGQPLVKAYTDNLSWWIGTIAIGAWGVYRWSKMQREPGR